MKNYAILRDAIDEKVFGLVVENNGAYQFYGADQRSTEWATWANSTATKSLVGTLPVGVVHDQPRPLVHDSESFIEGLIESAANNPARKSSGFSYKGSEVHNTASTTPSARDFQLRSFDIDSRTNAINFKALAFKSDQKASSLLARMRSAGLAFNEKTGQFKTSNVAISKQEISNEIANGYKKSLQRSIGLSVTATKAVHAKSLQPFYVHPNVVELKRLGGPLGSRIGRGLRSAPAGMVFVDVTGAVDADKDGIVFEGKPGLERPIVPRFILPESVGRRVASLIGGTAEDNEKNRRAGGMTSGAIDESKLREILGSDADSLSALTSQAGVADTQERASGMRSLAGNIRSRRDAIIGRRTSTDKLSRVGRGGKTQVNTGDSRAVEKMSWDDDAKELIVTFAGGRTYTYKGVDDSWVKEIENNPDALGRIMNDIKKAGYDFEAGGDHAPDSTLASRIQGRREAAGMRSMKSPQQIRKENILETTWAGEKPGKEDLKPNADLGGADLSNQDLTQYDLSGAVLALSDLSGSKLPIGLNDANLDEAILENVDGGNSILNGASLLNADLSLSDFSDADLGDTNLTDAWFYKTNLSGANLELARANGAMFDEANLEGANLENIAATRAGFKNANMRRANLAGGDLRNSNFNNADLTSADLGNAALDGANLRGANLESANLSETDILGIDLRDANLRAANLRDADLRKSDLRGADLSDADLRDADLTGTNIDEADFDGANLEGALLPKGWEVIDGRVRRVDENRTGMESSRRGRGLDAPVRGEIGKATLEQREAFVASDEYEQLLEDYLVRNPGKSEREFKFTRGFHDAAMSFDESGVDLGGLVPERDDYEGWTQDEIDAGIPEILRRGMESTKKSTLTPEGETAVNAAAKKLSEFAKTSNFGDVYPGAETFDKNNERHQIIQDMFEDADMPSQRVQDVLNAMQVLRDEFGEDSDVGYTDRMTYALDHIAPTFDARLSLSKGVRRGGRDGMGSRVSGPATISRQGVSSRARTASIERTAISSPMGMSSARKATVYKSHRAQPGQEKVSTNDGKLWASLSREDKELFAKRAVARESQIIEILQDEYDLPITGTDRRLDDPTLSPAQREKILKSTGGGKPFVVANPNAPGFFLLNEEGVDSVFYGEYSVGRKAKALADEARTLLEQGKIDEHKDKVAKLDRLLRLSDDLLTLAGARIQGEGDDSLIDKVDSYDLAIDHLHPVSRNAILTVAKPAPKSNEEGTTKKKKKKDIYVESGAVGQFEFKFTTAQKRAKSTAIEIPGRPLSAKYDFLQQAGVINEDGSIGGAKRSKVGRFAEFLRVKFTDLSKADEKARQKRIEKMRKEGINIGSVAVGESDTDRPTLLDKRSLKISAANRKKLLNSKARSVEKLTESAEKNINTTPVVAQAEDGKTLLTPDGITALAKPLKIGEKEWRKTYSNRGKGGEEGHALAFLWTASGMNGTPHPVNEEEYGELLKAGWRPIKRGTGTRGYAVSYMDYYKRFLPPAGEAYGPGEYWSTGTNTSWTDPQYYPEPMGELGDGPGGIAGLLPPTARIATKRDMENIRDEHRKFSAPILGVFYGYPKDEWNKVPQDEFVDVLVKDVFDKIPRDSDVWDSAIGQMTLQLIRALESNPSAAEYAKLRDALYRLTATVNQHHNVYGPLFGYDALDVGGDVLLLMNRAAVTVFADPLTVAAAVSLGKGNGLPSGYVVPGK